MFKLRKQRSGALMFGTCYQNFTRNGLAFDIIYGNCLLVGTSLLENNSAHWKIDETAHIIYILLYFECILFYYKRKNMYYLYISTLLVVGFGVVLGLMP